MTSMFNFCIGEEMAVNRRKKQFVYGLGDDLIQLPPRTILTERDPTTADKAEIGTFWINTTGDSVWCITSIVADSATWTTSPASGVGTFTSVTVTTGDLHLTGALSDIVVDIGDLTLTAGDASIGGDLTVTGDLVALGDFDITSSESVGFTSTKDAAEAIYFKANGGTSETILVNTAQGTLVTSINLKADVGGITLNAAALASDDAINLEAPSGGIDIDGALQVNIASSEAAADAIVLSASAGGVDITSTGAGLDVDILSTGGSITATATEDAANSIYLHANGGVLETIRLHADQGTDVASLDLLSDVGGISLTATALASDDAINIAAGAGGVDIDGALQVNIASSEAAVDAVVVDASAGGLDISSGGAGMDIDVVATGGSVNISATEAAADAIVLDASDGAGGVEVKAGTGGILIGNEADTATIDVGDFAPTASRTITVAGGTVVTAAVTDLVDIAPDGATTNANSVKQVDILTGAVTTGQSVVNINSGTAASGTHTVNVSTGTGGGTKVVNLGNADGLTTLNIDAITLINDSLNVNTSINTGTSTGVVAIGNAAAGAISMDTAAGISLDAATASNFTVTGAADLTLDSSAGSVNIAGGEAAVDAVVIGAAAGGIDITSAGVSFDIDILATGGSINVTATEDAANAIYLHANGGVTETIKIHSDLGTSVSSVDILSDVGGVTITGGVASADAINIVASDAAGGIDIDAGTGGIAIDSTGAIALTGAAASSLVTTGAGIDIDLLATAGSITITGAEAANDAIAITASDASGGIDINAGTGGIDLISGGAVSVQPATATVASPAATAVINKRVGVATFTGFTTAAAASQTFTITNSVVSATSAILVTVSNLGSNDAQMTQMRVKQGAGSFEVMTTNNGAAALNGNVVVTFWVIA